MSENSPSEVRDINSSRPFKKTARDYYHKGFVPFPLPPKQKEKPPFGVTGRKPSVLVTPRQLDEWIDAAEQENIGIKFGIVLVEGRSEEGIPDGEYVLIGIDVDNYIDSETDGKVKKKAGGEQLVELEERLGKLPDTWISSARADGVSGIRFFLAPSGLEWKGKASDSIDVIQPNHRYAVVWPSWHPKGGQYLFTPPGQPPDGTLPGLYGYRAHVLPLRPGQNPAHGRNVQFIEVPLGPDEGDGEESDQIARIPEAAQLPLLPEKWVNELSRNRTPEQDVDLDMDISVSDLDLWVRQMFVSGKPCRQTKKTLQYWVDRIEEDPSSHDKVLDGHWQLSRMGILEGHPGALRSIRFLDREWKTAVLKAGKRGPTEAKNEIFRSSTLAWRKIKKEIDEAAKQGIELRSKKCSCEEEVTPEQLASFVVEKDGLPSPPGKIKDVEEYDNSDWGRAEMFLDLFTRERIRCVVRNGRADWYFWKLDGSELGWVQDNDLAVRLTRGIGRVYRMKYDQLLSQYHQLKKTDPQEASAFWRERVVFMRGLYERIGNAATINNLLSVMKSHTEVSVPESYFDSNPELLGFDDGVIVLRRGEHWKFREKKVEDRVTRSVGRKFRSLQQLAMDRDPGIQLLQSYREQFVPDSELWKFMQMVFGYALYGANPDRVIFFFHGVTSTGKSTLINALYEALGPGRYSGSSNADIFNDKDGGRNPELLKTRGLRFVQLPEFGEGSWITNDSLKRLASEDPISVRDNYAKSEAIEEFEHTALFIGPTNSMPRINGMDNAVLRRIRVLPFDNVFEETAENTGKGRLMKTVGKEAVLAWALEGWNKYVDGGMSAFSQERLPAAVVARTKEFTNEMSAIGDFINDYIEVTGDSKDVLSSNLVYQRYRDWAESQGIPPQKLMDQKKLSTRISQETGMKSGTPRIEVNGVKKPVRGWPGLRLIGNISALKYSGFHVISEEK